MKIKVVGIVIFMLLIATILPGISGGEVNKEIIIDTENFEYKPGEIIVKFTKESTISNPSIEKLNEKYQVSSYRELFKNSEETILDNIYVLSVSDDSDILSIVEDYSSNPNIVYAEPNGFAYLCKTPNDENFSKQWAFHNTGQTGGIPDCDVDAVEAWDVGTGSEDIVIAIIDTGIDYNHPDLIDNMWINEGEIPDNGIDDDSNGYIDDYYGWDFTNYNGDNLPLDSLGHGTYCAGIAGAVGNNSIGIAGICWDCRIMNVQIFFEGVSNWEWISQGIKYAADNGADVLSMSFGYYKLSRLLKDAIDYANEKDIVMVAGAGNFDRWRRLYPAGYNKVIAVGATDHNDSRMYYYDVVDEQWYGSQYGFWVDVCAPGQDMFSTTPTYPTNWTTIYGIKEYYDGGIFWSGTSYATPIVAGVAALMLLKDNTLTPSEIKTRIKKHTDPYNSDKYIGTGRINAHQAITKARSRFNTANYLVGFEMGNLLNRLLNSPILYFLQYYMYQHSNLYPILRCLF